MAGGDRLGELGSAVVRVPVDLTRCLGDDLDNRRQRAERRLVRRELVRRARRRGGRLARLVRRELVKNLSEPWHLRRHPPPPLPSLASRPGPTPRPPPHPPATP